MERYSEYIIVWERKTGYNTKDIMRPFRNYTRVIFFFDK